MSERAITDVMDILIRMEIQRYTQYPTILNWYSIRGILVTPHITVWQALSEYDAYYYHSTEMCIAPDPNLVISAIKQAIFNNSVSGRVDN